MLKLSVFFGLMAVLWSCSGNQEETLPAAVVLKEERNDMDAEDIRSKVSSSDVQLIFTDREGNQLKKRPEFHEGDELFVKVNDMKQYIAIENYSLGITPLTNNIQIKRLDKTRFRITIDKNNTEPTFQLETYLYAQEVTFTNTFHDTIDGYDDDETGHSFSLLGYAFPIEK